MSKDFDRSFDFFQNQVDVTVEADKIWNIDRKWVVNSEAFDNSFEQDLIEFSVTRPSPQRQINLSNVGSTQNKSNELLDVAFKKEKPKTTKFSDQDCVPVKIVIHEQLTAMYNDFSQDGEISCVGSIFVHPAPALASSFCLVVKDMLSQVQKVDINNDVCEEISTTPSNCGIRNSEQIIKLTLNKNLDGRDILVANYSCISQLRPVPLVSICF